MSGDKEQMSDRIADSFNYLFIVKNIRESLEIEGIHRDPYDAELHEWERFMKLERVTVEDLQRFVYVYCGAGVRLRNLITDSHQIGKRHLEGGSHVLQTLAEILEDVYMDQIDPFHAHVEYEYLHPFTDGNGRSGRMIWHWMMKRKYGNRYEAMTSIGFLRRYYYQSIKYLGPL